MQEFTVTPQSRDIEFQERKGIVFTFVSHFFFQETGVAQST
jgi:hypothetical protein